MVLHPGQQKLDKSQTGAVVFGSQTRCDWDASVSWNRLLRACTVWSSSGAPFGRPVANTQRQCSLERRVAPAPPPSLITGTVLRRTGAAFQCRASHGPSKGARSQVAVAPAAPAAAVTVTVTGCRRHQHSDVGEPVRRFSLSAPHCASNGAPEARRGTVAVYAGGGPRGVFIFQTGHSRGAPNRAGPPPLQPV